MHTRSLRLALLSSLGLVPFGCRSEEPTDGLQLRSRLAQCVSSTPVPAEESPGGAVTRIPGTFTGIERCDNGVLHRPAPVTCSSGLPRPLPPAGDAGSASESTPAQSDFLYGDRISPDDPRACEADADCSQNPHGYCGLVDVGIGPGPGLLLQCLYGCVQDADCGPGAFCECGDPVGHCVAAGCRSDADCEGELLCAALVDVDACSREHVSYACQAAADECDSDADCPESSRARQAFECEVEGGRRQCIERDQAACGRPFLVQGSERLAELRSGDDWTGGVVTAVDVLALAQRSLAAEHWARAALMEHASIAAFARFTLQLLHLGAPRELIEASQQAMLDETAHAKACFALASRYLESSVEPGPLAMDAALDEQTLEAIAVLTFREGCVGETVAALEAREALDDATNPEVRAALGRIAIDEQRHAELAWRFVSWALARSALMRPLLDRELSRLEVELFSPAAAAGEAECPEHGVLSERRRQLLRRTAVAEVVLPCLRQVLALPPAVALEALA